MQSFNLRKVSIICIVLGFMLLAKCYVDSVNGVAPKVRKNQTESTQTSVINESREKFKSIELPERDVEIKVNYPDALSYKTRGQVYDLRKKYVKESIFNIPDYEPSNDVFGSIIDNKPWYALDFCRDIKTNLPKITGPSEEARFISNPSLLVALEYPFLWNNYDEPKFCNSPVNQLIPWKISYSKSYNEIRVNYRSFPFRAVSPHFYDLNGLNARDLGYEYAYVDLEKSTFNGKFSQEGDNVSTDVQQFKNFIHLGYSCEHEGGCNNGSPRQPNFEFNLPDNYNGFGDIYIKLWRSKPKSPMQKADIVERIIVGY